MTDYLLIGSWQPIEGLDCDISNYVVIDVNIFDACSSVHQQSDQLVMGLRGEEVVRKFGITELPSFVTCNNDMTISSRPIGYTLFPTSDNISENDALLEYDNGNIIEALKIFFVLYLNNRKKTSILFNLSSIFHFLEFPSLSLFFIEEFLLIDGNDPIANNFLWVLCQIDGMKDLCVKTYLKLAERGNLMASNKLVYLGKSPSISRTDPQYVEMIYDNLSSIFETKLVNMLKYSAPWKIFEVVKDRLALMNKPLVSMLDLGCGTGLCGDIFRPLFLHDPSDQSSSSPSLLFDDIASFQSWRQKYFTSSSFSFNKPENDDNNDKPPEDGRKDFSVFQTIGIDISLPMLQQAQIRGGYSMLIHGDIYDFFHEIEPIILNSFHPPSTINDRRMDIGGMISIQEHVEKEKEIIPNNYIDEKGYLSFDVILAADTLIYFGLLGPFFHHCFCHLPVHGIFSFTTEDWEKSSGYQSNEGRSFSSMSHHPYEPPDFCESEKMWWGMTDSCRFAHSNQYILALSRLYHFEIVYHESIVLRQESSIPVPGNIFVLLKTKN